MSDMLQLVVVVEKLDMRRDLAVPLLECHPPADKLKELVIKS